MKIYRMLLKRNINGKIEDLEVIQNGFSIFALIFQIPYLLYNKMWSMVCFFSCLFIILGFTFNIFLISIGYIIVCLYISLNFANWKFKKLISNGYEFLGYSEGNSKKDAKERFLENLNRDYNGKDKLKQEIF
jgi:hypothetical protein